MGREDDMPAVLRASEIFSQNLCHRPVGDRLTVKSMVRWWVGPGAKFILDRFLDEFDGGLHDDHDQIAIGHFAGSGDDLMGLPGATW